MARRKRKASRKGSSAQKKLFGRKKKRTLFSIPTVKRQLSQQQEFEVMKMVLDKFLWLGFIIMAIGLYGMLRSPVYLGRGAFLLALGAFVLLTCAILLVKEYELFTW